MISYSDFPFKTFVRSLFRKSHNEVI